MKLVQTGTIQRKVTVEFPDPKGGDKPLVETFIAHYKILPMRELGVLKDKMLAGDMSVPDVLDEVLERVEDVQDANGTEMSPSDALEAIKDNVFTSTAALRKWSDIVNPEQVARKNSRKSSRR